MASTRSLYDILNVSHDAEGVVIEAAYRALMKKYHPDQAVGEVNGNSSAAEINQAFAVLRDPKRRAGYDRHEYNERNRSQPVRLEPALQPPPPRRSGFAWTGWLVALLLGAILYAVLDGRGGLIVPPPQGNGSASAEFDHRTQPVKIAPALEANMAPTPIDREILLRETKAAAPRRSQGALDEAAEAARDAAAEVDQTTIMFDPEPDALQLRERAAPNRPRARPSRRNGRAGARTREDEDFLKREGYIY
ncbi:MAG: J domain-containing protein [Allosphingosinicella sp.]